MRVCIHTLLWNVFSVMRFPCNKLPAGKIKYGFSRNWSSLISGSLVTVLLKLTALKMDFLYCIGLNKCCLNCYPVMVIYRHHFNSWVSANFTDLFARTHRLFLDLSEKSIVYYFSPQNGVDESYCCLRQTVCSQGVRSWFCLLHWR